MTDWYSMAANTAPSPQQPGAVPANSAARDWYSEAAQASGAAPAPQHAVIPSFGEYLTYKLTNGLKDPPVVMSDDTQAPHEGWREVAAKKISDAAYGASHGVLAEVALPAAAFVTKAAATLPGVVGDYADQKSKELNDFRKAEEAVYQDQTKNSFFTAGIPHMLATGGAMDLAGISRLFGSVGQKVASKVPMPSNLTPAFTVPVVNKAVPAIATPNFISAGIPATVQHATTGGLTAAVLPGIDDNNTQAPPPKQEYAAAGINPTGKFAQFLAQEAGSMRDGAIAGPLMAGATKIVGSAYGSTIKPIFQGGADDYAVNAIKNLSGHSPEEVIKIIQNHPEYVPGSVPTLGTIGRNNNLLMAQRHFENTPAGRELFSQRQSENNIAREALLRNLAGDDDIYKALTKARNDKTAPLYAAIHDRVEEIPSEHIYNTFNTPVINDATQSARRYFGNNPSRFSTFPEFEPDPNLPSPMLNIKSPYISGGSIQKIGQNVGDQYSNAHLNDTAQAGRIDRNKTQGIEDVAARFFPMSEQLFPELAEANRVYSQESRPLNTMELARALLENNKYRFNANDVGTGEQAIHFTKIANNIQREINNRRYPISDEGERALQGLAADMRVQNTFSNSGPRGSDTYFNFQLPNWIGAKAAAGVPYSMSSQTGPTVLSGIPFGIGSVADKVKNHAYESSNNALARILLGGKESTDLLNNYMTRQENLRRVTEAANSQAAIRARALGNALKNKYSEQ